MSIIHKQLFEHLISNQYLYYKKAFSDSNQPFRWTDSKINDRIIFSHRQVEYTNDTFEDDMHSHDFCEVVFYISGDIHFVVENKIYHPQYGDIFVVNSSEIHTAKLEAPSTYNRYVLWFDEDCFDHFKNGKEIIAGFLFNRNKGEKNLITLPDEKLKKIYGFLNKIEASISEPYIGSNIIAFSYLLQLFVLINNHKFKASSFDRSVSVPDCILNAVNYIDNNYLTISTVAEVAEKMHVSREHMSRLFKQYYGTTVNSYIKEKRISESKRLLISGSNATEACYNSGFNNLSYFIKCFKKSVGLTPFEYKRFNQIKIDQSGLISSCDVPEIPEQ